MFTRSEIASLMASVSDGSEEISEAAIGCMVECITDPIAALDGLASEIGDGPDSAARREMVEELRAAMRGVGL